MTGSERGGATTSMPYAFAFDPGSDRVLLVDLSDDVVSAASFLDHRVLAPNMKQTPVDFAAFERMQSGAGPAPPPGMIFHMGHCGSTLISKLAAAATGTVSFREPHALRTFAFAMDEAADGASFLSPAALSRRLGVFLANWSRHAGSTVKASSICTDLMTSARECGVTRAVFLYLKPPAFLAGMLGGEANRADIDGGAAYRRRRLRRMGADVPPLWMLSPGERAALIWIVEAASAAHALGDFPFARAVDFDAFLASPASQLDDVCQTLGLTASASRVAAAVGGPLMTQYSKAPEHQFTPSARAQYLAAYAEEHAAEIRRGLDFLDRFRDRPPVAAAFSRFGA